MVRGAGEDGLAGTGSVQHYGDAAHQYYLLGLDDTLCAYPVHIRAGVGEDATVC